ncbi:MAG: hypothetical protein SCALA702_34390 [Melioribacteraceae bacterium]|nr:MAG: hypothetical protein SCALA702_34390 [Melioribacteraceae bacterium]
MIVEGTVKSSKSNLKSMNTWIRSAGNLSQEDRNKNWIIEIQSGVYSDSNWHNIIWGDRVSNPNSGYTLTIRPETGGEVTIKGGPDVERALKIGSETSGLILENLTFDGFYRVQILMYKSSESIIRNCTFQNMNREGAWAVISVQDCQGEYNNNVIEGNLFQNLDSPGIGLHAVYLTRSDNTIIRNNTIYYCSGGVFKCVDGSDNNIFDANTIYDGCGDIAYFIGRNGTGQTVLSRGNVVTNTHCMESEGYKNSHAYDTLAYKYVRKFVYSKESWSFYEYEWPDNYENQHDSLQPFYIPRGHDGNKFDQIREDFGIDIDPVIDKDPAFIYLKENNIGNTNNPLFRAKYEFDSNGASLIFYPFYHKISGNYNKYLDYILINDLSKKPRIFEVDFTLRTCEGEIIEKGDLSGKNGVLELQKWIVSSIDNPEWISDIEGANQSISFSNENKVWLELYNSENLLLVADSSFVYELEEGENYNLFVSEPTKVTIRPVKISSGVKQVETDKQNFVLGQNYPNPFNPITTISYSLQESGNVNLRVFDITGKEVCLLVNEVQEAGLHSVEFNAKALSSGVYFYRIISDDYIETKKCLLIK